MSRLGPIAVSVAALDLTRARTYLASVAAMCTEGAQTDQLRVTVLALRVLERQAPLVLAQFEGLRRGGRAVNFFR